MVLPRTMTRNTFIATGEVGHDDATIRQFERGAHQAAQAVHDHVSQCSLAKDLGAGVIEIGRQLVEQDQRGPVANDGFPLALVRELGGPLP